MLAIASHSFMPARHTSVSRASVPALTSACTSRVDIIRRVSGVSNTTHSRPSAGGYAPRACAFV